MTGEMDNIYRILNQAFVGVDSKLNKTFLSRAKKKTVFSRNLIFVHVQPTPTKA